MQKKIPVDVLAALRESGIGIAPSVEADPTPSMPPEAPIPVTPISEAKPSGQTAPPPSSPSRSTAAPANAGASLKMDDSLVRLLPSVDGSMWDKYRRVALGRSQPLETIVAEAVMFYGDNFL